jgi:hypothetical protein
MKKNREEFHEKLIHIAMIVDKILFYGLSIVIVLSILWIIYAVFAIATTPSW